MDIQIRNLQKIKRLKINQIAKHVDIVLQLLHYYDHRIECSIVLCDNAYIQMLNKIARAKNKPTDVLSFPQYTAKQLKKALQNPLIQAIPLGDIVISIETTCRQAKLYNVKFSDELNRLLVHGLLHLLGYDHEKNSAQSALMQKKQEYILHSLKEL